MGKQTAGAGEFVFIKGGERVQYMWRSRYVAAEPEPFHAGYGKPPGVATGQLIIVGVPHHQGDGFQPGGNPGGG